MGKNESLFNWENFNIFRLLCVFFTSKQSKIFNLNQRYCIIYLVQKVEGEQRYMCASNCFILQHIRGAKYLWYLTYLHPHQVWEAKFLRVWVYDTFSNNQLTSRLVTHLYKLFQSCADRVNSIAILPYV